MLAFLFAAFRRPPGRRKQRRALMHYQQSAAVMPVFAPEMVLLPA